MGVQVLCVFTSASNPNSFYGLKIWGYMDKELKNKGGKQVKIYQKSENFQKIFAILRTFSILF